MRNSFKEIKRQLRVLFKESCKLDSSNPNAFKQYMELVSVYRNRYNTWMLPSPEWHSSSYIAKNEYYPSRKLSIILKQWSIVENFEF